MTLLDGLGSIPQTSSYSAESLGKLHQNAALKLAEFAPISNVELELLDIPTWYSSRKRGSVGMDVPVRYLGTSERADHLALQGTALAGFQGG